MMMGKDQNEVVLVLSQEEYDYMYKLLLDYGAYAPPENMRTTLAKKIALPNQVRDDRIPTPFSWLRSLLPRRTPRFDIPKGRVATADKADSSWNPA